jgi:hypothetical protein
MGAEAGRDGKPRRVIERAVASFANAVSATETALPAGDGSRRYRYRGEAVSTERELVTRFLDDFQAAEAAGAAVLSRWAAVARDPLVRGGLRALCARETRHGELLGQRLRELGAVCRATLDRDLTEAADTRLGSPETSDLEKLRALLACHADVDTMLGPIRDVIAQIDEDQETRALLAVILEEEVATLRWISATCRLLETRRSRR